MSRLFDLISTLCPNGVSFACAGDLVRLNGYKQLGAAELEALRVEGGSVPLLPSSRNYDWFTTKELAGEYLCDGEVFTMGRARNANTKYNKGPFVSSNNFIMESANTKKITTRFLFHYLTSKIEDFYVKTSTYPKFDLNLFKKIKVPVPPLEVQNEVVRILDNFTSLTAELTAELAAREKQFEHYRTKVIEGSCHEMVKLSSLVTNVFSGSNKERLDDGMYPVYGSTGIISSTNSFIYSGDRILIARVGANAGLVHIASGKYDVSDNTLIVGLRNNVNLRYMFHFLSYYGINRLAKGGGQPLITASAVKQIEVFLPSKSEQDRIALILDSFCKLIGDSTSGLVAEINANNKRYEYYRDKLLDFRMVENESY